MTPLDVNEWQPPTFAQRGVAIPFTSPMLAGARARLTERRCDLVVPQPGGMRGVRIFALGSLGEFCAATMHDLRLAERIAGIRPMSPQAVRLAARSVAADGSAGRGAALAAASAALQDRRAKERFEMMLLQSLVREAGGPTADPVLRTAQAVLKLASRTGHDAGAVKADIERLSDLLASAGLGSGATGAGRCSALLDTIDDTRKSLACWLDQTGPNNAAEQLAEAAGAISAIGRQVLGETNALLDDPAALLTAWATGPEIVLAKLFRPDWLLDGWEGLCLLWRVAETDEQRADAVAEACSLTPSMPMEADSWIGSPELLATLRRRHARAPASRSGRDRPGASRVGGKPRAVFGCA